MGISIWRVEIQVFNLVDATGNCHKTTTVLGKLLTATLNEVSYAPTHIRRSSKNLNIPIAQGPHHIGVRIGMVNFACCGYAYYPRKAIERF